AGSSSQPSSSFAPSAPPSPSSSSSSLSISPSCSSASDTCIATPRINQTHLSSRQEGSLACWRRLRRGIMLLRVLRMIRI
ncbi:MAG: hypothetical protein Q9218_008405, partial [Villophora microphyllina]